MGSSDGSFNVTNYGILEVVVPVEAKPLGFQEYQNMLNLRGGTGRVYVLRSCR